MTCACGEAMVRIGEDMSERLDVVPAEFFVHRQIRLRRCQSAQWFRELLDNPVPLRRQLVNVCLTKEESVFPANSSLVPTIAPQSKDEVTADVVSHMGKLSSYAALGIAGLLAFWIITTFIKGGIGNGIFAIVLAALLFTGALFVLNLVVLGPMAAVRYGACLKRIAADLPGLGISPSIQWTWKSPGPGLIAIDTQRRLVFIESEGTGYHRLILEPAQVIGAKVERTTELHTQTKHSGSFSVFSRSGLGYNFGGKSKSKTSVVERAFLELHCVRSQGAAPMSLVVPFGPDRRSADSMAVAIMHMKNAI